VTPRGRPHDEIDEYQTCYSSWLNKPLTRLAGRKASPQSKIENSI
jgi:hypothetical protein